MQTSLFDAPRTFAPIILRPYQRACVEAIYAHLRERDDNPCAVVPTGGGKTPIMATICKDAATQWSSRVLILAHVKELLEQAADKLRAVCAGVPVGIYSAGLGRKDVNRPITVAGIQSIYKKACELDPFDLVFVDEAHLIAPDGDGMYRQFLAEAKIVNPRLRVVGLTATPFRTKSGPICTPDGFLNHICFEVGVRELIVDGFLSPLITKSGLTKIDTSELAIRAGEFDSAQVEALVDRDEIVAAACREIFEYAAARKSALIFGTSVAHCGHIRDFLGTLGAECQVVTGETPDGERARILDRFKRGDLKFVANVNVLTTGFDAPNIDCVALMRPTNSPGLYYQMVGRGFRLNPGKRDCLVLDFGGNVLRHGPVDRLEATTDRRTGKPGEAAAKECPQCHALIAVGYALCPDCGFEFPAPERKAHDPTASEAGILSGQVTTCTLPVTQTWYSVHVKRGAEQDAPRTLRVDYLIGTSGETKSEWVCLEHDGFARRKAEAWWGARSPDPIPDNIERAVEIAEGGGLAEALEITVRAVAGDKFERIVDYKLGPRPEAIEGDSSLSAESREITVSANAHYHDDDLPF